MLSDLRTVGTWVFACGLLAGSLGAATATQEDGQTFQAALRQGAVPIAAGFDHACGLTPAGEAYCWGSNDSGELGDGSDSARVEPTRVAGGLSFTSISAGHNRTCAIASGGALYCWGKNAFGELGNGSEQAPASEPTRVSGDLSFVSVSVGPHHSCGVVEGGALYCWGYNPVRSARGRHDREAPRADAGEWGPPLQGCGSGLRPQLCAGRIRGGVLLGLQRLR